MIRGIPFSDKINLYEILDTSIEIEVESIIMPLYDLAIKSCELKKNYIVIIEDNYFTWLEDICFNYRDKICYLPYYSYSEYESGIEFNPDLKYSKHLLVSDFNTIIIRYNYKLEYLDINVDDTLIIYSIKDKKFYEVHISSYIEEDFYLSKLYSLYKKACYYDDKTEFSNHEGGYTFITKYAKGFVNQEYRIRLKLGLPNYIEESKEMDYKDVVYYDYFKYITKFKNYDISDFDLFKYRNLRFESYLYCSLRQELVPKDYEAWNKLGVSNRYIKIKDDVPFFIKYYWLNDYNFRVTESWLNL